MDSSFQPDAATLMLTAALITPLIAAADHFLWRQTRERGLLWWAGGAFAMAGGTLALLSGSQLVAVSTLGGISLVLSHWAFYCGVRAFHEGRAFALRAADRVLLGALAGAYPLGVVLDVVVVGPGLASLLNAFIAAACAYPLIRPQGRARASAAFTGGIFALDALLHGAVGVAVLLPDPVAINWPLVQAATFVLLVGWSFGFLMLIGQRDQELLAELANSDELTGANTRRALLEKGRHLFAMAARQGPALGVMMLDIDFFKAVNDSHGHAVGDLVLKNFARVVGECLRASDIFGRIGGEEFCVLLPDTGLEGTTRVAERIRANFAASTVEQGGQRVGATVSIGVAVCDADIDSLDALIARADEALYEAKHQGRDRVVCAAGGEAPAPLVRLVWDARYRSGHPAIDREHEYLFEWANALLGKIQTNAVNGTLEGDVKELLHWLSGHFRNEEEVLAQLKWDGLERHTQLHRALEARGAQLLAEVQSGRRNYAELLDFVVLEIIARHLARHDTQYFHLLKASA